MMMLVGQLMTNLKMTVRDDCAVSAYNLPQSQLCYRRSHPLLVMGWAESALVQPHGRQPTRLPGLWDSSGKNTGVGCHCLFQCMKVKSESEVAQSCSTLCDPMDCSPPGSSAHGIFQATVLEWGAIAFSNVSAN